MNKTGSEILDNIVDDAKKLNLNLLYAQIRKSGEIKGTFSATPKFSRLNVFSISKCFTSAILGIALEEGLLSLDEYICDAFPEYVPKNASENLLELKVHHLLTMTTGLSKPLFFGDDKERYTVIDWIEYFFNAEFSKKPGKEFLYSNFNTYILSCLIERRAGKNLLEYSRVKFFEKINVNNPDWVLCPKGHVYGANGLSLTITELANFGDMLLNYGEYNGIQVVPKDYLKTATTKKVDNVPVDQIGENYQTYGYGYHFWMTPIEDTFICNGNYGQFCLVMPKKDIVISSISFEGHNYKKVRDIIVDYAKKL